MIKPPLTRSIASLLSFSMVAAQPIATVVATAGPSYGSGSSAGSAAERERIRRYDYLERGKAALAAGEKAMRDKDYETAVSQYKLACDLIPNSPNTQAIYAEALHGFCKSSCRFAEQRITEGRYIDAQVALKTVIDERYNPRCRDAVIILARLETPGYYNQTIGPKFRASVEEVKQLLLDAQGFYDSGRYNLAFKRCEQVLNLDPYNMAARKMQEKIDLAKDNYAVVAQRESRGRMIWQVDQAWAMPVRKFGREIETGPVQDPRSGGTARINAKLQQIVIPKLEFRQATIREAVDFLKKRSAELDPTTDVQAEKGVNIVLQLNEGGGGSSLPAPAPGPAVPAIPGLE
ncbi:MAG: type II and III secretion system protein, partial [Chthoniobacteraceae bacterium]